jgi:hypothetical protein
LETINKTANRSNDEKVLLPQRHSLLWSAKAPAAAFHFLNAPLYIPLFNKTLAAPVSKRAWDKGLLMLQVLQFVCISRRAHSK